MFIHTSTTVAQKAVVLVDFRTTKEPDCLEITVIALNDSVFQGLPICFEKNM